MKKSCRKILFRADSSNQIGLGHIMRDLVLAEQYRDDEILFACRNLEGHIMDKIPYPVKILSSMDIEELILIVKQEQIDMLVIDHYGIRYEDEKRIKEVTGVKIFVLDDTYERHYCDVLLNHNISADAHRYHDKVPKECEVRCGSEYTLLRDEFYQAKKSKTIFVAMGGTDHSNLNIKILKVLEKFPSIKVHLITTSSNANLKTLKKYSKDRKWIKLHIDSNKIAKLMKKSDFAIVTPSVTVNEAHFMNLPFIAIKTADNQEDIYRYLLENQYKTMEKFDKKVLKDEIAKLLYTVDTALVDFTDLSLEEKKMVLAWRNDKRVRRWMFAKEEITLSAHLAYIESLKSKRDKRYFLVKRSGEAIGVVDFVDITKKRASFGIYAKPSLKGVGDILMMNMIEYAFTILKIKTLISEVLRENRVAIKLYRRHGFKIVSEKEHIIKMELKYENR